MKFQIILGAFILSMISCQPSKPGQSGFADDFPDVGSDQLINIISFSPPACGILRQGRK